MIQAAQAIRCAAVALLLGASLAHSQATATANQTLQLSAFAGGSGVYTGLNSGRNLSFTAGADLALRRYLRLNPALELRGTFPVNSGKVDGQRNVLGGLRFSGSFRRLHPYADILFGRGELKYNPPLLDPNGAFLYTQSTTNVLSPGVGFEYDLSPHFALRADAQLQRYSTPVATSSTAMPVAITSGGSTTGTIVYSHLYAKPITVALTYRFDFNRRAIHARH